MRAFAWHEAPKHKQADVMSLAECLCPCAAQCETEVESIGKIGDLLHLDFGVMEVFHFGIRRFVWA